MKKLLVFTCSLAIAAAVEAQKLGFTFDQTGNYFISNRDSGMNVKSSKNPLQHVLGTLNTKNFSTFMEQRMGLYHWPGMQIGILHNGKLAWKKNFGMANLQLSRPVTDSTVFRLFSVSKTFVATAMMQRVEAGEIDLYGDINDYLTSFEIINPFYPQAVVSPKMVLTHAASISDNFPGSGPECSVVEYMGDPQVSLHDFTVSHFVDGGLCYGNASYLNYPPGSYCTYSNPGASLGGYIVESVSGTGFNEYCNDSIFDLLGMNGSRWFYSELDTSKVAMIYEWNGNYVPNGLRSWVIYPAVDLKSNVTELSNYLEMYMNYGNYNGIQVLDSTSIDLITTVYDTMSNGYEPLGLIWCFTKPPDDSWWPPEEIWQHTGARGSFIFFNKQNRWGGALTGNGGWFEVEIFTPVIAYAGMFTEFAVSSLQTADDDGNGIYETGETIQLVTGIFNNLMDPAQDVVVTLQCDDPCLQVTDSVAVLGNIDSGQSVMNTGQPFQIQVINSQEPHAIDLQLMIKYNSNKVTTISLPLFVGSSSVLLVKDETDVYHSERYYLESLDSLGVKTRYWDISVNGNPDSSFLKNFPVIVWYTGYDQDTTINEANQEALMAYLESGGRLFMTGQDISDDIGGTEFCSDYLHVGHLGNMTVTIINGVTGDTVSDGLTFHLNVGNSFGNQFWQSKIEAVNGGIPCFRYGNSTIYSGVRFENTTYKTVFLGFGFEGIDYTENRYTLMKRILEYFDISAGQNENPSLSNSHSGLKIIPNPAGERVFIAFPAITGDALISIYDVNGRKVIEKPVIGDEIRLDISILPSGVYFVRVQDEKRVEVAKMVKE
jgi:CubicO group peptidase (beta-lactamase class C family)